MTQNKLMKSIDGDDAPNIGRIKNLLFDKVAVTTGMFRRGCMIDWKNVISEYENQFRDYNYLFWFEHELDCAEDLPY